MRPRSELPILAALAAVLLAWFAGVYVVEGYAFPVGPDAPVYLWWTRLAAAEGLSAVDRPGVPALALTLAGTLGLPLAAVTAALGCALGAAVGLAAAALARASRAGLPAWSLAGLLAGTFASHLAAGYLANLAFASMFIASAVLLAAASRRAAVGASAVLAGAALAHPLFLGVGAAILLVTAGLAWRADRAEAARTALAVAGAGAAAAAALLALQAGPHPPRVDTSRDAFLRRAGLTDVLRSAYLDRLVRRWARYVQWASVPLAFVGFAAARGFVRRFLLAWAAATAVGVAAGAATGWFPPDRFITFGFVVPLLAALGVARLPEVLRGPRAVAVAVGGALAAAMMAGATIAWFRQEPFVSVAEVRQVEDAGRYAVRTDPDVAVVFPVRDDDGELSFLATRLNNVVRAALPASLARRVFVSVGPPDGPAGVERRALTGVLAPGDGTTLEREVLVAYLDSFGSLTSAGLATERVAPGIALGSSEPLPAPAPEPVDPLAPASTAEILLATVAVFGLLAAAGYGWSRTAIDDAWQAAALSPAVGAAAIVLVAIALERIGVPLGGRAGPLLVSAAAVLGGLAVRLVRERRAVAQPSP